MTHIVRTTYRYRRPPRRKKPVAIEVPEIATVRDRKRRRAPLQSEVASEPAAAPPLASTPAILPIRRKSRFGRADDIMVEEANRRADLANEMVTLRSTSVEELAEPGMLSQPKQLAELRKLAYRLNLEPVIMLARIPFGTYKKQPVVDACQHVLAFIADKHGFVPLSA